MPGADRTDTLVRHRDRLAYALCQARFESADALLFGSESAGLPAEVLESIEPTRHLSIPMRPGNRSLNLANAVAVVVYEAWRQQGFRLTP